MRRREDGEEGAEGERGEAETAGRKIESSDNILVD
jgi:hypothetical protein